MARAEEERGWEQRGEHEREGEESLRPGAIKLEDKTKNREIIVHFAWTEMRNIN